MGRLTLLLLTLGALTLLGCKNKDQQATAHKEEAYVPSYTQSATSLDAMDAAPPADAGTSADTSTGTLSGPPPAAGGRSSDEVLAPSGGRVHVVQKGDTLFKLARQYYNDQARWRDIWEANKTRVPDPNKLQVGTRLIIP